MKMTRQDVLKEACESNNTCPGCGDERDPARRASLKMIIPLQKRVYQSLKGY